MTHTIMIGNAHGEHVSIDVSRRSHPGAKDYWDGNWVASEVRITVGGFRAKYQAELRVEEFQRLRDELIAWSKTLSGDARFDTIEGQLDLSLEGDGKGHIAVVGVAMDRSDGNRLDFKLELDQTYLPGILRTLDEALEAFPVIGRPGA